MTPEDRANLILTCIAKLYWLWGNENPLDEMPESFDKAMEGESNSESDQLRELKHRLTPEEWKLLPAAFQAVPFLGPDALKQKPGLCAARLKAFWNGPQLKRAHDAGPKTDALKKILDKDFLGTMREIRKHADGIDQKILLNFLRRYVQEWSSKRIQLVLDPEQADALISTTTHTLVTARAGSGKTRTLVARAAFLVKHCGVSPSQILMLAFNRKAAAEMQKRLKNLECDCPHVMTFHSLAYGIVHPEEALIYDEPEDGKMDHSAVLQRVVNGMLDDPNFESRVRHMMISHFKQDWEKLTDKGLNFEQAEGLQFRRALTSETLRGDFVKSFGEKVIANFLFEHDIPYQYERSHWWQGRNYRPDFTLEGKNIVIEYSGMVGEPEYDKSIDEKREYWKNKSDWTMLEYSRRSMGGKGEQGIEASIRGDLEKLGLKIRKLSEEEIWAKIRERTLTRFAAAMKTFTGRCRKNGFETKDVLQRIREHDCECDTEQLFLELAIEAFSAYLDRLNQEDKEDFDGLMARAGQLVAAGTVRFSRKAAPGDLSQMRFIMIDEYQDFSPLFNGLLEAIRQHNSNVQCCCVGDNWQAINGFAGSDLKYFDEFGDFFQPCKFLNIATNYRSAAQIVDVSNAIMENDGPPARPCENATIGRVLIADLNSLSPESEEKLLWGEDRITPAVRRLIREAVLVGKSVTLLARRDGLPYFVPALTKSGSGGASLNDFHRLWTAGLSEEQSRKVVVSTAHGYKGLEDDYVIVLDAVASMYPLIHPDRVFARMFGDTDETLTQAERRLFYVACTRAIEKLVLITEFDRASEFLLNIKGQCERLEWSDYVPFCEVKSGWIVKVGSMPGASTTPTFERKALLKARGFVFHRGDWPYWANVYSGELSVAEVEEVLRSEDWIPGPDGLEIKICKTDGTVVATRWVESNVVR